VPAAPAAMTTADSPPYASGRRTTQNTSAAIKTSAHSGLNARMIAKFPLASVTFRRAGLSRCRYRR